MFCRLRDRSVRLIAAWLIGVGAIMASAGAAGAQEYTAQEIVDSGHRFFGATSGGLGSLIEKIFASYGLPNGYVLGEEGAGAFVAGLTYGEGTLYTKNAGDHKVFWQGPSIGWDFGGQGSRTMILVYNLDDVSSMYQRFAGGAIDAEISQIRAEKARLQSEVAALTRQMSLVLPDAKGGDANEAVVRLGEERDRLEARLTALTRENKKLRASLSAQERAGSDNGGEERRENALLREQIHELAAEVVNMTATLEGPDSPIRKALAGPVSELPQGPHDRITSLAERVKALQKEAPLV